ncbi:bifunctional hydroxymethylpyrimidine kinase/phosphomethylpyrimidine kinase [Sutterella massiliensis]|uniref:hydroxymethylpyrimidine kinase n=1 Tax=Sutterella massiliensis TaxID=1816689 RepID=A0ABS2DNL8_9BURK|nr:bifunctional hydroxymethylpyrimidine kinase/phosphomethylpyrimidine kinase [Sutterella massiliensis]MBM6702939.1 bifunctional hydroxymethylpyrimidine kinase/phosphomethylpyrimidine kinase [Sutterella massiliensis]
MEERKEARIPNVVSIAGVDPSGGAGIFADIKAMSACGAYACGVVAALTAQSTRGVFGVLPVSAAFVRQQLDVLFEDVAIDAVKIGMLNDAEVIETVAQVLEARRPRFVVLDPVMVAKSKDRLLAEDALGALRSRLLPLATVVTPNLPEAAELLGVQESDAPEDMAYTAKALLDLVGEKSWVLLKGGHLAGDTASDLLLSREETHRFEAKKIATKNTHGTGCTLSSALAALLPQSNSVPEAVERAKAYITGAIRHADDLQVGSGHGPTHHFWQINHNM